MLEAQNTLISSDLLLGFADSELALSPTHRCLLHPLVVEPLDALTFAAEKAGFVLKVASSYRNFERQLLIWNSKATGIRPVLDTNGIPLDITQLSDKEKIFAILHWSALPGASRHHWGTDVDVYDASRISPDYSLQLTVAETEGDGPFTEFHQWLSAELKSTELNSTELNGNSHGFYRPYQHDIGGIAPEPWHLSYAPVATLYAAQFTEDLLRKQLQKTDIALKETLLENLGEIYQRFIQPYC